MGSEILLVRDCDCYRVLHGHLRLATIMSLSKEAFVIASGEGQVKVITTPGGILVGEENRRLPLQAK